MTTKKLTLLASIGAGLEYYDFIIYGLLASYLGHVFFPATDSRVATLQAFGVFAIGYLARPLGGVIFGNFGDRYGRKNIFLTSIILMAITTFVIGLLPTYPQWGLYATALLIVFRTLQGFAFGAELPGTITFLSEHVSKSWRGLHCGFAIASVSLGATLGSFIIYLLNKLLTQQQMSSYGWRIPFLLGGVLAIAGYFMRTKLHETPLFMQYAETAKKQIPFFALLKQYPKQIILGLSITFFSACFIVFGIGLPAYLKEFYDYQPTNIYFYISLGYIWCALILPLFGWFSDIIGRPRLLFWTSGVAIIGSFSLFNLLTYQNQFALAAFIIIYETIIAALVTCYLPMLAELFPTSVRFTGFALCYNIVYCIASFTPFLLGNFNQWFGGAHYTYLIFDCLAGTTLLGTIFIVNKAPELAE